MQVLPPAALGGEMIDLLRDLEEMGEKMNLVNALHRASEVLHAAGQVEPAATIYGWLNGRAFRTEIAAVTLDAAMAESARTFGTGWDRLIENGRGMTLDSVVGFACEALAAIT
jgi:hypothetical protein